MSINKCDAMSKTLTAAKRGGDHAAMSIVSGRRIYATSQLQERYLNLIEKGEKKAEARINDEEMKSLKEGAWCV